MDYSKIKLVEILGVLRWAYGKFFEAIYFNLITFVLKFIKN